MTDAKKILLAEKSAITKKLQFIPNYYETR